MFPTLFCAIDNRRSGGNILERCSVSFVYFVVYGGVVAEYLRRWTIREVRYAQFSQKCAEKKRITLISRWFPLQSHLHFMSSSCVRDAWSRNVPFYRILPHAPNNRMPSKVTRNGDQCFDLKKSKELLYLYAAFSKTIIITLVLHYYLDHIITAESLSLACIGVRSPHSLLSPLRVAHLPERKNIPDQRRLGQDGFWRLYRDMQQSCGAVMFGDRSHNTYIRISWDGGRMLCAKYWACQYDYIPRCSLFHAYRSACDDRHNGSPCA